MSAMKTKSILILLTVFLISNSAALAATVKGERAKHLNDVLTAISRTAPDAISWGDCSMGKCILEVHKVKCENKSKDKNSEATCSLIAIATDGSKSPFTFSDTSGSTHASELFTALSELKHSRGDRVTSKMIKCKEDTHQTPVYCSCEIE